MTNDMTKTINEMPKAAKLSALTALLDWRLRESTGILAFRGQMGQSPSYISSVPLEWIADHVQFAGEMPIFSGKVDEISKKITIDNFTIDHIVQRRPDWRRQIPMVIYLAAWEKRKFPPLLVVGHQIWVDGEGVNWDANKKAIRESVTASPPNHRICEVLVNDDSAFYALDGQHRLMAILGLRELMNKGWLPMRDQDGNPQGEKRMTIQDVADAVRKQSGKEVNIKNIMDKLQRIMSEQVGIEIIPAVKRGEEQKDAGYRLRNIFVDVNENAKHPTKGESILLDEQDGFRIVAQQVMVWHPFLKDRVYVKMGNLPATSHDYTTLDTLVKIARRYMGYKDYAEWNDPLIFSSRYSGPVRPKYQVDLDEGAVDLGEYFDELRRLPSHARMIRDNVSAAELREEEDHILFRPVVQMAFAEASAILKHDHGISLKDSVDKLIRQEKMGQLKLKDTEAPWCGVIWDSNSNKMRTTIGAQKLCQRLFVYLLGAPLNEKQLNQLREKFSSIRKIYGGNPNLPAPWQ